MNDKRDVFTIWDAAKFFGVHFLTVQRWVAEGRITISASPPGTSEEPYVFLQSDIDSFKKWRSKVSKIALAEEDLKQWMAKNKCENRAIQTLGKKAVLEL